MHCLLSSFAEPLQIIPLFFPRKSTLFTQLWTQNSLPWRCCLLCLETVIQEYPKSVHGRRKQNGHQEMEKASYNSGSVLLPRCCYFSLSSGGFWASVGIPSLLHCTPEGTSDNPPSSFETNNILLSQHLENQPDIKKTLMAETFFWWWADWPFNELYI